MAEIQASVKYSEGLSKAQTLAGNADQALGVFGNYNYTYGRKPDYYLYLYNYGEMELFVSRPPLFQDVKFGGRQPSEKAHFLSKLPQPILLPKGNVDSGEVDPIVTDTRRLLTDLINPDNLGIDQDALIAKSTSGGTNDLGAKGLFWSYNGPGNSVNGTNPDGTKAEEYPTETELLKARKRVEKHYRDILNKIKATEVSDPKSLPDLISPEAHQAAHYFGETFSWHSVTVRADYCSNCGEKIRAGAAYHKMEDGGFCILDWDRAIKSGIRTKAQAYEATGEERFAPVKVEVKPVVESVEAKVVEENKKEKPTIKKQPTGATADVEL